MPLIMPYTNIQHLNSDLNKREKRNIFARGEVFNSKLSMKKKGSGRGSPLSFPNSCNSTSCAGAQRVETAPKWEQNIPKCPDFH